MGRSFELTAFLFVGALIVVCHLLLCSLPFSQGLPLSTRSQWIVDDSTGGRVKLACVNWVAHLTPMLAEGLDKRPLRCIVHTIASWGFNCVRLTWATSMFTDASLANMTVSKTFAKLSLKEAMAGIAKHNPKFLHLSTVEAFKAVAGELGRQGVMVVLDNQMSRPGWCCGENDGNGFWGDPEFDPGQWLQGLIEVASTFRNCRYVVAMSLRNELRGSRQNVPDWYKYMQMGAEAIHEANPNLLVIHGGLSYAQNLRFLASKPLDESLQSKIVYEVHRYSFTNGDSYTKGNLNDKCASVISQMRSASGFVTEPNMSFTGPLFVSEFGVDQTGARPGDARFIACLFAFLAEGDLDWALWAFQGSYYLRQGTPDLDETFGLLNHAWQAPRNASLLRKLQSLQPPFVQDPDLASTNPSHLIFHPATGLCINRVSTNTLFLDSCTSFEFSTWTFTAADGKITLDGTRMAIAAQGDGLPALLAVEPSGEQLGSNSIVRPASWNNSLSSSRMQFATQLADGEAVCLDGTSPPSVFTRPCICLHNTSCSGLPDPSGQWFKLVTTSRLSRSSSL